MWDTHFIKSPFSHINILKGSQKAQHCLVSLDEFYYFWHKEKNIITLQVWCVSFARLLEVVFFFAKLFSPSLLKESSFIIGGPANSQGSWKGKEGGLGEILELP